VDDGSEEVETLQALQRAQEEGTRVIRQENQGLSAARNAGVRATDAPFFVALDADDRIVPQFVSKLLPPLLNDPTLGYSYSHARLFGAAQGEWASPAYDPQRLLVENLSVATAVVRRTAFDEVGGYSRDMVHGFEDWDFWLALLSLGYYGHCVPELLIEYRKHAGGSMLDTTQRHRPEMIRCMIEHHRALFSRSLEVSMARKDSMFFEAHMDAARLRESIVKSGEAAPPSTVDDALYQSLLAKAELDYIESSRFWCLARRLGKTSLGRAIVGTMEMPAGDADDPCRRIAWIKASRAYRMIQWVKRTPPYKWYGRRRHGPDFDRPPLVTR
jgi:GT2 family glycosyltransferase